MKIAINGAGIAGTALAYWLHYFGHEPVLIEQALEPRKGGYLIDFWGIGYDIAEKMGLIPELERRGYYMEEVHWVNEEGKKQAGFDVDIFRKLAHGRYVSIERSELAAAIYDCIRDKVEIIFGDSISNIEETGNQLHVGFEKAPPRNFDLVVGAEVSIPGYVKWFLDLLKSLKKTWACVLPLLNWMVTAPVTSNR